MQSQQSVFNGDIFFIEKT